MHARQLLAFLWTGCWVYLHTFIQGQQRTCPRSPGHPQKKWVCAGILSAFVKLIVHVSIMTPVELHWTLFRPSLA